MEFLEPSICAARQVGQVVSGKAARQDESLTKLRVNVGHGQEFGAVWVRLISAGKLRLPLADISYVVPPLARMRHAVGNHVEHGLHTARSLPARLAPCRTGRSLYEVSDRELHWWGFQFLGVGAC